MSAKIEKNNSSQSTGSPEESKQTSKSASTSKPISQSVDASKSKETGVNSEGGGKKNRLKRALYTILLGIIALFLLIGVLFYYQFIPRAWFGFAENSEQPSSSIQVSSNSSESLVSTNPTKNFSVNNGEPYLVNQGTSLPTGRQASLASSFSAVVSTQSTNVEGLYEASPLSKINQLEKEIQKPNKQLSQQRKIDSSQQYASNQLSTLIALVTNHTKKQQEKMIELDAKVAQFSRLINRWKKRLSDPDLLIDTVYNHLQLIQSQMTLNYSPEILSEQLEEVDKLVAELNIEELSTLRLELQTLAKKLDFKPSIPLDSWLREIQLAEQLIPSWIQQSQGNRIRKNIFISSSTEINTSKKNAKNTSLTDAGGKSFWQTLKDFVSDRVTNSFTISKNTNQSQNVSSPSSIGLSSGLSDDQIYRYLTDRLELLRISVLSRNWDVLRQQSVETDMWLSENLPIAQQNMNKLLAMMSQYKPDFVDQQFARAIVIIQGYRQELAQQKTTNREAGQHSPQIKIAPNSTSVSTPSTSKSTPKR